MLYPIKTMSAAKPKNKSMTSGQRMTMTLPSKWSPENGDFFNK